MAMCWAAGMQEEAEAEPGPTGAAAADACMVRTGGWLAVGLARKRGLLTDQGWVGDWAAVSPSEALPESSSLPLYTSSDELEHNADQQLPNQAQLQLMR